MTAPSLLVTGASGYLGRHLIRQAAAQWRVVAAYFSHPEALPTGVEPVRLDVRDGEAVARVVDGLRPAAIVHAAADMTSEPAMDAVIAGGARHVAAAAAKAGARLVAMSTDVVFDGEHGPYAESDAPRPITAYGRAKAEAERLVVALCPTAAIVRTSLIYGFAPADPRTLWVVDSLRYGRPITLFTDELRCPVWAEQLASALLDLAGAPEGTVVGVWHVAGPQSLNRYEFGVRLARLYGLDPAGLTAGLSRESGPLRPRDCRLTMARARAALSTPLWGVDEVLAALAQSPTVGSP